MHDWRDEKINEILFYAGIVFAGFFLLLSFFLFFYQKVPSVIRYFMKMGNKRVSSQGFKIVNAPGNTHKHSKTDISRGKNNSNESGSTELLDIAQNYATALLDADSTTLLPYLNDTEN